MKQRRHSPEQVIRKLAEGENLLNQGPDVAEVCRQLEIPSRPGTAGGISTAA